VPHTFRDSLALNIIIDPPMCRRLSAVHKSPWLCRYKLVNGGRGINAIPLGMLGFTPYTCFQVFACEIIRLSSNI
jgi:hypothetical protein